MRGSKEVLWAVVIPAALITAGLILSCGDDGGVGCKEVCEKFEECEILPDDGDVEDCIEHCEEDFDPTDEGDKESFECIVDTDCDDLKNDCLCLIACEKFKNDCGLWVDSLDECVNDDCAKSWDIDKVLCILNYDCNDILAECFPE